MHSRHVPGHFRGTCANCKFQGAAAACSVKSARESDDINDDVDDFHGCTDDNKEEIEENGDNDDENGNAQSAEKLARLLLR